MKRRDFITAAALAAAFGLAGKPVYNVLANKDAHASKTGKRLAMVIDLKKFEGNSEMMDKCVDACHSMHNVPDIEGAKEEVKWIWPEPFEHAFLEQDNQFIPEKVKNNPVLLMCNHCDNPPCVGVCPPKATWKRAEDGVVMMDWHRCIGCRYCMAACPYGSRSFNWRDPRPKIKNITAQFPTRSKGVVEKCTFCDERIVKGLEPACVVASKMYEPEAMVFGDLNDDKSNIRKILSENYSIRRKPELSTQPEVYYLV